MFRAYTLAPILTCPATVHKPCKMLSVHDLWRCPWLLPLHRRPNGTTRRVGSPAPLMFRWPGKAS